MQALTNSTDDICAPLHALNVMYITKYIACLQLEAVGSFLQSLMSRLGPPKGSGAQEGKRRGYLVLVCALMKVYFKLNNIGSCSQLNRTVQKTFGDDNLQVRKTAVAGCRLHYWFSPAILRAVLIY